MGVISFSDAGFGTMHGAHSIDGVVIAHAQALGRDGVISRH